jgi:diguanylate cyclase (GGDEF)-like protein
MQFLSGTGQPQREGRPEVDQEQKRSMSLAATLVVVASAVLLSLYALGQYTLKRMLARDAVVTAELWLRTARKSGLDDIAALAGPTDEIGRALGIAQIDGLVLVRRDGARVGIGEHGADAERDFARALGLPHAGPAAVRSGVYTPDTVGLFRHAPFRTWVVFPADGATKQHLGVRIEQTATAAALAGSFVREVMFSGGVATITFASFMAGFHYRQRKLAAENAAIRHLALHDQLTGLPNRKQFEEFIAGALAASSRDGDKAALFMLDLDGFKAVNDTLGHPVGDGLLRAAAKRLKASLRTGDLLARLSGDEFAIVVPRLTDPAMLAPLAERILHLLSSPFRVDGHEIQVGCSIGLAIAPDNGNDAETLMRNADFALYRAKTEGRRTWRFFDPDMAKDLASRRILADGLRHALEREHFELLYQPQIELSTGRTIGYEAMLRWRLPGKGLVPASVFVTLAEETGLVVPIGEWVIRQVARDSALVPPDRKLAINLSSMQLKRDGIEEFIAETLKSHKIAPGRIEIEVNESILGRNESAAFARLEKIRALGVGIVMDSFGLGSISLGLLSRYSFDKVKVNRAFLIDDEQRGIAMLSAICGLGRSLGFRVAGQGVEAFEHAQLLRVAGCAEGQGYYFSPPMSLKQVLAIEQEGRLPELATVA